MRCRHVAGCIALMLFLSPPGASRAQAAPAAESYSACLWRHAAAVRPSDLAELQGQCDSPERLCAAILQPDYPVCLSELLIIATGVLDGARAKLTSFPAMDNTAWDDVLGNPDIAYVDCVRQAYEGGDIMSAGDCIDSYYDQIQECVDKASVSRGYCEAYFAGEMVRFDNRIGAVPAL